MQKSSWSLNEVGGDKMERLELILPVTSPQISAIKVSCLCASTPEGIYTEHVSICCASTRLDLSLCRAFACSPEEEILIWKLKLNCESLNGPNNDTRLPFIIFFLYLYRTCIFYSIKRWEGGGNVAISFCMWVKAVPTPVQYCPKLLKQGPTAWFLALFWSSLWYFTVV